MLCLCCSAFLCSYVLLGIFSLFRLESVMAHHPGGAVRWNDDDRDDPLLYDRRDDEFGMPMWRY